MINSASPHKIQIKQMRGNYVPFPLIEWVWSPELEMKIPCSQEI
jgi:hypothetical protein